MKRLFLVLGLLFIWGFWAGCSKDEDGQKKGSKINIPTNPPSVSGGSVTKGGEMENAEVTNLKDFIDVYLNAIYYYDSYPNWSSDRSRSLPEEYWEGTWEEKGSRINFGRNSGRAEIEEEGVENERETSRSETEIGYWMGTVKFFDFSHSGELFLGGAVGFLDIYEENDYKDENLEKYNGTINFQGKYKGKVVFDNVVSIHSHDDNYNCINIITGGRFYVESYGKQIRLPDSLLYRFSYPQSDSADYGNTPVINRTMPRVPSAPSGRLTDRGGASVTSSNVDAFFYAVRSELFNDYYYSSTRGYESKEIWEELEHGRASGYMFQKENSIYKRNNSGSFSSVTGTTEYFDYSNEGSLYLGGGIGRASTSEWGYVASVYFDTYEHVYNGKVNFNGQFKGTLEFKDFRYKEEYRGSSGTTYSHVSGSVSIGSLGVTQEYMDLLRNKNNNWEKPNGGDVIDLNILINAQNEVWDDGYGDGIVFYANGTFDAVSGWGDYWEVYYNGGGTWYIDGGTVLYTQGADGFYGNAVGTLSGNTLRMNGYELTKVSGVMIMLSSVRSAEAVKTSRKK